MDREEAVDVAHELMEIAIEVECERALRAGDDPEGDVLYREVARRFHRFVEALGV